jgi:hypothetical protein
LVDNLAYSLYSQYSINWGTKMLTLRDLPNQDGFEFNGYASNGDLYACRVVRGLDGCHRVQGLPEDVKLFRWSRK